MNRSIDTDYDIRYQRHRLRDSAADVLYRLKELSHYEYSPKAEIEEIIECLIQLKKKICIED